MMWKTGNSLEIKKLQRLPRKYFHIALIALGLLIITAVNFPNKTVHLYKYTVGGATKQYETRHLDNQQAIKMETISLNISGVDSQRSIGVGPKGEQNGKSQNCRLDDVYMCVSSATTTNSKNIVLNFRAKKISKGDHIPFFDYEREIKIGSTSSVSMQITGNRWIRIFSGTNLLYAYRFNGAYGVDTNQRDFVLYHSGIQDVKSENNYYEVQNTSEENSRQDMIVLLLSAVLIASGIYLRRNNDGDKYENSPEIRKVFKISILVSSVSMFAGLLGLYRRPQIRYDVGISFEPLVRFSDFFQVWSFSDYSHLYRDIQPDYPPLQILVFKALGAFVQPEVVFLIILAVSIIVVYFQISSMLGTKTFLFVLMSTVTFYPLLYAIERGSLDLVILPIFACALLLYDKKMYTMFALLIGIVAGLKIFPIIFIVMVFRQSGKVKNTLIAISTAFTLNYATALILPETGTSEIPLYSRYLLGSLVDRGSISNRYFPTGDNSIGAFFNIVRYISTGLSNSSAVSLISISTTISVMGLFTFVLIRCRKFQSGEIGMITLIVMLLIVPNSFNYRLLYFIPMLWFWNRNRSGNDPPHESPHLYVAIGLVLSAHPIIYYQNGPGFFGQVVNAPLLIFILLSLITKNLNQKLECDCQNFLSLSRGNNETPSIVRRPLSDE